MHICSICMQQTKNQTLGSNSIQSVVFDFVGFSKRSNEPIITLNLIVFVILQMYILWMP